MWLQEEREWHMDFRDDIGGHKMIGNITLMILALIGASTILDKLMEDDDE